ncbi:serine hydrolase domain-containing protein [Inhella crocodyli]|uniref:serine hydrolase domain-containing protein n=1 Tax=Inhella crocodyli TaxID=2499851 RepID=UPI0013E2DF60|nr:serine hydrolase [Inhella crocodyli]
MHCHRRTALVSLAASPWLARAQSAHAVDRALADLVRQGPLAGLAVRLRQGGTLRFEGQYGLRRLHDEARPMVADAVFRIASVTKLAVALAALRLHEAGRLPLEADLGRLLGLRHPQHPRQRITPRHLLTHTSGLRDAADLPPRSGAELRQRLADPATWGSPAPGAFFSYCNLAFVLLGTAMEAATGQRLDALMHEWLFEPLGMDVQLDPAALRPDQRQRVATLYRHDGMAWQAQADAEPADADLVPRAGPGYVPGECASALGPQGGLRASLPELDKLAQCLRQHAHGLLRPATFAELARAHWQHPAQPGDTMNGLMRSWGLGVQRFGTARDAAGGDHLRPDRALSAIGHLGEAYGLLSGLLVGPARGDDPGWTLLYAINGTPNEALAARGHYNSFSPWEEALLRNVLPLLDPLP